MCCTAAMHHSHAETHLRVHCHEQHSQSYAAQCKLQRAMQVPAEMRLLKYTAPFLHCSSGFFPSKHQNPQVLGPAELGDAWQTVHHSQEG